MKKYGLAPDMPYMPTDCVQAAILENSGKEPWYVNCSGSVCLGQFCHIT